MKIYYEKRDLPSGRFKYVAVGMEKPDFVSAGSYLLTVDKNNNSYELQKIKPDYPALLAAARVMEEAMVAAMLEKSHGDRDDDFAYIPSIREIVKAGINVLVEEEKEYLGRIPKLLE